MIKVECARCGKDCSNACGTYLGYPFHFGCLPQSPSDMPWDLQPVLDGGEDELD